jgi:microcin C transport system permease protein
MDARTPPDAPSLDTSLETMTPLPGQEMPPPKATRFTLSPINRRRWASFVANRRGFWSLWIFLFLFVLSLGRVPGQRPADPRLV